MSEITKEEMAGAVELAFDTTIRLLSQAGALAASKEMKEKKERAVICTNVCHGYSNEILKGIERGDDKRPPWLTMAWEEIERLQNIIKEIHYRTDNSLAYECDVCNGIRKLTTITENEEIPTPPLAALTTPQPEASDREIVEEVVRHVVCLMIEHMNTDMMDDTDVEPTVKSIMEGYTMASADWSKFATIRSDERRKAEDEIKKLRGLITEAWGTFTDKELVVYDPWEGYVDDLISRLSDAMVSGEAKP